ncbi:MAG: TrkA family potassium uptake protein [Actinomycetaceae bacterium]|nr:TrkA family potassium uptake protein [Actinomycetaceae bacterium]
MRTVIAGAGSVGRSIARELLSHGHEVTLVDIEPDAMRVASVAQAEWILADACSPEALVKAGIEQCDAMVAATGDDRANLVISLLSKSEFGVPKVVARVNNPKNEWMFDDSWGVDVQVSTPRIMTSLVEEAVSIGALVRIFSFQMTGAAMYSAVLPPDAPLTGRKVGDIHWPLQAVLAAILRDGRPMNPQADDIFEQDDELLLLLAGANDAPKELAELSTLISSPQEQPGKPQDEGE